MHSWSQIIEAGEYVYYGVRVVDEALSVGHVCEPSHVWDDGTMTGELLDGACAIQVRSTADLQPALDASADYVGTAYLVAGYQASYGVDPGEVIIKDAVVLA